MLYCLPLHDAVPLVVLNQQSLHLECAKAKRLKRAAAAAAAAGQQGARRVASGNAWGFMRRFPAALSAGKQV